MLFHCIPIKKSQLKQINLWVVLIKDPCFINQIQVSQICPNDADFVAKQLRERTLANMDKPKC
jgi:hypothetical protein